MVDNPNILSAGARGPALLEDIWLIKNLAHFDREVTPERRTHATGWGPHGIFAVTNDVTRFTKATLFSEVGKETPLFAHFSTVAGERGAADAERDIRGFAVKFYTEEGNWDIVGNNTPVFFFRDPLRFPDLSHAIKRDLRTSLRSADNNWDFWSLLPEALHQVTIAMSDRSIPRPFRHTHGFCGHTFSLINADNERTWAKFHFRSLRGIENFTDAEAATIFASDRESHDRDLLQALGGGAFPKWRLSIQVTDKKPAKNHKHHHFPSPTVWSKRDFRLLDVGVMELTRHPSNHFAEVEQAAFSPANVVPGVGFSSDRMLQGQLFSYGYTQRYRLGANFNHTPINAAKCPVTSYHRDGKMRVDCYAGAKPSYWPNSKGAWIDHDPTAMEPPLTLNGAAEHYDHRLEEGHFEQPGNLFRMMRPEQKMLLFENTARALDDARIEVKQRHIDNCGKADPTYGDGVARALGMLDRRFEFIQNIFSDSPPQSEAIANGQDPNSREAGPAQTLTETRPCSNSKKAIARTDRQCQIFGREVKLRCGSKAPRLSGLYHSLPDLCALLQLAWI